MSRTSDIAATSQWHAVREPQSSAGVREDLAPPDTMFFSGRIGTSRDIDLCPSSYDPTSRPISSTRRISDSETILVDGTAQGGRKRQRSNSSSSDPSYQPPYDGKRKAPIENGVSEPAYNTSNESQAQFGASYTFRSQQRGALSTTPIRTERRRRQADVALERELKGILEPSIHFKPAQATARLSRSPFTPLPQHTQSNSTVAEVYTDIQQLLEALRWMDRYRPRLSRLKAKLCSNGVVVIKRYVVECDAGTVSMSMATALPAVQEAPKMPGSSPPLVPTPHSTALGGRSTNTSSMVVERGCRHPTSNGSPLCHNPSYDSELYGANTTFRSPRQWVGRADPEHKLVYGSANNPIVIEEYQDVSLQRRKLHPQHNNTVSRPSVYRSGTSGVQESPASRARLCGPSTTTGPDNLLSHQTAEGFLILGSWKHSKIHIDADVLVSAGFNNRGEFFRKLQPLEIDGTKLELSQDLYHIPIKHTDINYLFPYSTMSEHKIQDAIFARLCPRRPHPPPYRMIVVGALPIGEYKHVSHNGTRPVVMASIDAMGTLHCQVRPHDLHHTIDFAGHALPDSDVSTRDIRFFSSRYNVKRDLLRAYVIERLQPVITASHS